MLEIILVVALSALAYYLGAKGVEDKCSAILAAAENNRAAAEEEAKQCRCAAELFKAAYENLKANATRG